MTERQIDRMKKRTDRVNPVEPPLFQSGAIIICACFTRVGTSGTLVRMLKGKPRHLSMVFPRLHVDSYKSKYFNFGWRNLAAAAKRT